MCAFGRKPIFKGRSNTVLEVATVYSVPSGTRVWERNGHHLRESAESLGARLPLTAEDKGCSMSLR